MKRSFLLYVLLVLFSIPLKPQSLIVVPSPEKKGGISNIGNVLLKFDQKTNSFARILVDGELLFLEDQIKISPDGKYIAAVGLMDKNFLDESSASYSKFGLVILDAAGKVLYRIEDAATCEWSPSGDKIAFAKGIKYSDKPAPYTEELWLFDVIKNEKESLGGSSATRIHWAPFDTFIYSYEGGAVFRINPKTKQRDATNYRDINFSPKGNYYFKKGIDSDYFAVFESISNKEITPRSIRELSVRNFAKWMQDETLIVGDYGFDKIVINIPTQRIKATITGMVCGVNPATSEIYVNKSESSVLGIKSERVEKIRVQ